MASLRPGVWVSCIFGVQRGPVLKGRRLVNFANPWLLLLPGFQGFCCLSLAPGMATTWVRDHHLDFRTCSLFIVKRRVGEEMRGNLIGTRGVQSWDLAQEPIQDHQPAKTKGLLAARSVRRRSRRLDPKKNIRRRLRNICVFCEILDVALLALEGGSDWHRSGRVFGSAAFFVFSGILF